MDREMEEEIGAACEFLARLISAQLSVAQQGLFKQALARLLKEKYADHWDPSQPMRGNAYRSIMVTPGFIDPVLLRAAAEAEVRRVETRWFPTDLVVWIDPFEVTYRFGEMGSIARIYLRQEPGHASTSMTASGASSSTAPSAASSTSTSVSSAPRSQALPLTSSAKSSALFPRPVPITSPPPSSKSSTATTTTTTSTHAAAPTTTPSTSTSPASSSSSTSTSTSATLSPSSVKSSYVKSSVSEASRILVH